MRRQLEARGFVEVETPMMQPLYGGATARPFVTHHNTLDIDLYLRIAPELYLKRLLVGGFDRVFELNRNFRNEGISIKHNPEFTMVEAYQAYADGTAMLTLTEDLIRQAAKAACGNETAVLSYQGVDVDFGSPFRRLSMLDAVKEVGGVDPAQVTPEEAVKLLPGIPPAKARNLSPARLLEELFAERVEAKLIQPTFIIDFPVEISPLA